MSLYHSAKGSVNYTVVGSPTIVNGVANGFSSNDYIRIGGPSSAITDYEIVIKFNTPQDTSKYNGLLRNSGTYFYFRDRTLTAQYWFNGSNRWRTLASGLNPNTTYYLKIVRTGGDVWYSYISTDGINYRLQLTEPTQMLSILATHIILGYVNTDYPQWTGSIDLNETYIKVNGQPWFGVCPIEVQKHQLMGPVGYSVVGSPTIVDGIASGFSNSNYLALPQTACNGIEICVKFRTNSTMRQGFFSAQPQDINGQPFLLVRDGGILSFSQYQNSWQIINSNFTVNDNNWHYAKLIRNNTSSALYHSSNGIDFVLVGSLPYTSSSQSFSCYIGVEKVPNIGVNSAFKGSIDLNNTYIKVNGKLWFYQPADTKYIVKDGKLVWADPRIWLQSDGNQYIQTDYTPVQGDDTKVSFFMNSNPNGLQPVYSAGNGTYQFIMGPYRDNTSARTYTKHFRTGGATQLEVYPYALWADFSQHNGVSKLEVSGNTYEVADAYQASLDGNETTLRLFRRRNGTGSFFGKIKSFSITNNGVLKLHLVPVPAGLQIGNFTVPSNGMFDIVNQQFYANAGTGTFTIGRDE